MGTIYLNPNHTACNSNLKLYWKLYRQPVAAYLYSVLNTHGVLTTCEILFEAVLCKRTISCTGCPISVACHLHGRTVRRIVRRTVRWCVPETVRRTIWRTLYDGQRINQRTVRRTLRPRKRHIYLAGRIEPNRINFKSLNVDDVAGRSCEAESTALPSSNSSYWAPNNRRNVQKKSPNALLHAW